MTASRKERVENGEPKEASRGEDVFLSPLSARLSRRALLGSQSSARPSSLPLLFSYGTSCEAELFVAISLARQHTEMGMRLPTRTMMMLCLTVTGGCAPRTVETSAAPVSSAAGSTAELESTTSPSFNVSMTVMKNEPADTIAISPSAAWRTLRAAYASVGLQVFAADSASRSIASPLLRVHQFLGRQQLPRYLECGKTAFGDVAASQEIVLRVRSTVENGPDNTALVRTAVRAVATPQGNDQFRCTSTRRLEQRIGAYIREHATSEARQ